MTSKQTVWLILALLLALLASMIWLALEVRPEGDDPSDEFIWVAG